MLNSRVWDNLCIRLKNIARNKGHCSGVTMLNVQLFFVDGELVGWYKPDRKPIEPKQFDVSMLPLEK
jgi:hypothetical protein